MKFLKSTSKKVTVKIPGKIYLLGEYAIVHPNHQALIYAVNRFLKVTIEPADTNGFSSAFFGEEPIRFYVEKETIRFDTSHDTRFIEHALKTAMEYLGLKSISNMFIQVDSELDQGYQKKVGFGSSGAITVAILKAVIEYYHENIADEELAKLAIMTQMQFFPHSSYGDVVCSALGGLVHYVKGDTKTVESLMNQYPLKTVVQMPWQDWVMSRLSVTLPPMLVIDTNQRSSSEVLVRQVNRVFDHPNFQTFLKQSREIVQKGKEALVEGNHQLWYQSIDKYRQLLVDLQSISSAMIETESIKTMIHHMNLLGGHTKTSGAGGGDSLISFFDSREAEFSAREWLSQFGYDILEI